MTLLQWFFFFHVTIILHQELFSYWMLQKGIFLIHRVPPVMLFLWQNWDRIFRWIEILYPLSLKKYFCIIQITCQFSDPFLQLWHLGVKNSASFFVSSAEEIFSSVIILTSPLWRKRPFNRLPDASLSFSSKLLAPDFSVKDFWMATRSEDNFSLFRKNIPPADASKEIVRILQMMKVNFIQLQ